jgi:hypothetical protein
MYVVRRHVTETAGVLCTAYGTEGSVPRPQRDMKFTHHRDEDKGMFRKDFGLLETHCVQSCEWLLTFHINILPYSAG